ncbi:hypothetical protein Tco_0839268 [Tanacetum coccineum]|uniref:Secreted protein n=1 Tax=Tanacetum coccineum TaxID=301880 RepID=A0ABQ5AQ51_9ASTR
MAAAVAKPQTHPWWLVVAAVEVVTMGARWCCGGMWQRLLSRGSVEVRWLVVRWCRRRGGGDVGDEMEVVECGSSGCCRSWWWGGDA